VAGEVGAVVTLVPVPLVLAEVRLVEERRMLTVNSSVELLRPLIVAEAVSSAMSIAKA